MYYGCVVDGLLAAADQAEWEASLIRREARRDRIAGDVALAAKKEYTADCFESHAKILRHRAETEDTGKWIRVGNDWVKT